MLVIISILMEQTKGIEEQWKISNWRIEDTRLELPLRTAFQPSTLTTIRFSAMEERSVILEAVAHDKHCVLANTLAAHFASSSSYLDAARSHLEHATSYEKLVFDVISYLMSEDRDDDVAVELHSKANWYIEWHLDVLTVWALAKTGKISKAEDLLKGLKDRISRMTKKKQEIMREE